MGHSFSGKVKVRNFGGPYSFFTNMSNSLSSCAAFFGLDEGFVKAVPVKNAAMAGGGSATMCWLSLASMYKSVAVVSGCLSNTSGG